METFDISFSDDLPVGVAEARQIVSCLDWVYTCGGFDRLGVGLKIVGDVEMKKLNKLFRGKNVSTDVLSFPAALEFGSVAQMESVLGDIAISWDTAVRQARRCRHDVLVEVSVLLIHGLVHLCGYDHERSRLDAREMAELELSLLSLSELPIEAALVGRNL